MKNSLRNLETFTQSLARNSEKIDDIMARVDGVMGKADSLMLGLNTLAGGKDGGELFLTVKSIRELAEDFDKRSGALMSDGRTTLGDISRAVNNFDRNPTRVIFGGGNSASSTAAAPRSRHQRRPPAASGQRRQSRRPMTPGERLGASSEASCFADSLSLRENENGGREASVFHSLFAIRYSPAHPSRPAACASRV